MVYTIENDAESRQYKDVYGNRTYSTVIQSLAGYTNYIIMVLARTQIGVGSQGHAVRVKTLSGIPGKPRDIRFSDVQVRILLPL